MKKHEIAVCPGCKRHCPLHDVRCKKGRAWAEKIQSVQKHKWEKHVSPGGTLWQLLWTGRRVKKALRREEASEEMLLHNLSEAEQVQLCALLARIFQPSDKKTVSVQGNSGIIKSEPHRNIE